MKPIRTYGVRVGGYTEVLYSARSPSQARARAYRHFCDVIARKSFREFLSISSVRRVADPPGIGRRIRVLGEPATTVIGHSDAYVHFMRDDSNIVHRAHIADVASLKGSPP